MTEQSATTNSSGVSAGTIILLTEHNDDPGCEKEKVGSEREMQGFIVMCVSMVS